MNLALAPGACRLWVCRLGMAATCGFVGPARAAVPVTVTVDANQAVATMPEIGIGLHTSVYSNNLDEPALPGVVAASGVDMLRYPGGSYADIYNWSTHEGNGGYIANGADFGNFARILQQSDTAGMVTVNYGSSHGNTMGGQPKEAAAWVAYANGSVGNTHVLGMDAEGNNWRDVDYWARLRSSTPQEYQAWATPLGQYNSQHAFLAINRDTPIGIEYWEVGNEINGNGYYAGGDPGWEYDLHAPYDINRSLNPLLSPTAYGQNFNAFHDAMKAVDPDIKVGAVLVGGGIGNTNNAATNWDINVLQQAGAKMDFGIYHWYVHNGDSTTNVGSIQQRNRNLLNSSTGLANEFNLLKSRIGQYTGRDDIELHMTEFGYFDSVSHPSYTAFFTADTYANAIKNGAESVHFLELNKAPYVGDGAPDPAEAYYAIQMLDRLAKGGDEFVASTSSINEVRVHAVKQADGSIALMFINWNAGNITQDATVTVTVDGALLGALATYYEYGWDQVAAGVGASAGTRAITGNTFTITVPDVTIVTLIIPTVPEPASVALLGVAGVFVFRRRR